MRKLVQGSGFKMLSPLKDGIDNQTVSSEDNATKILEIKKKLGIPPYDPNNENPQWEGAMSDDDVMTLDSLRSGLIPYSRKKELEIMDRTWKGAHHGVEDAKMPGYLKQYNENPDRFN